jgi:hypothetical protein
MPGISPFTSTWKYRPSISALHVDVLSLTIGSAPGPIHIVLLPCQLPTL